MCLKSFSDGFLNHEKCRNEKDFDDRLENIDNWNETN